MDQVDEIKQKIDIVSLVGEYVDLKKSGRNFKGLCPFHTEKTPSFMVSPELQIFKCFGCQESGDSYSFLQKHEGMDFSEALKFLADRTGVRLETSGFRQRGDKDRLYEINKNAAKFYQYILLKHKAGKIALNYLKKDRGLELNTIKKFNLGFAPDVPFAARKFLVDKKRIKIDELEKVGLIYKRNGKVLDRFRGRVIFPLFDHRGNVIGFAGRLLPSSKKTEMAKYINTPETSIYHKGSVLYGLDLTKKEIKKKNEAVIVEGELDLISSWQAGVRNTVATKGTALTEDQVRLLSRFSKTAILALDTDLAGDTAARRGISIAQNVGLTVKVAKMGKFKDPDEAARYDPDFYKRAIKDASGVWDFIVDSIFAKHAVGTGQGKAKISKEIVPVLSSIKDEIVRAHYVQLVASKLDVPVEAVAKQVSTSSVKEEVLRPENTGMTKTGKDRRDLLEERLLALTFQSTAKNLFDKEDYSFIKTPLAKRIVEEYRNRTKKKTFNLADFAEGLPKELVEGFAEMVLKDTGNVSFSPEFVEKELALVKRELRKLDLKERRSKLVAQIRDLEKKGDKTKAKRAEKRFDKYSKELSSLEQDRGRGIIL